MDKNELIRRFAVDTDDRIMLARVLDKLEACEKSRMPAGTKFLNEHQRVLIERMLLMGIRGKRPQAVFFGGYEAAQRTVLLFLPDRMEPEEAYTEPVCPLAAVRLTYSPEHRPSHRDFLGSLMGCGIRRDTVGDILPGEGSCDLIVRKEIAPFLLTNLETVGKAKVQGAGIAFADLLIPQSEFRMIRDTVASLRLDSVASAGFSMSREKAAEAIRGGKVAVNSMECDRPDKMLAEGDRISLRGLGKIELGKVGGLSRKGRLQIEIKRFL